MRDECGVIFVVEVWQNKGVAFFWCRCEPVFLKSEVYL